VKSEISKKFGSNSKLVTILALSATFCCSSVKAQELISTASVFAPLPSAGSFFAPTDDISNLNFIPQKEDIIQNQENSPILRPTFEEIMNGDFITDEPNGQLEKEEKAVQEVIEKPQEIVTENNVIEVEQVETSSDSVALEENLNKDEIIEEKNVVQEVLEKENINIVENLEKIEPSEEISQNISDENNEKIIIDNTEPQSIEMVDLEGKTISSIEFSGVNSINPDDILVHAKSQVGNLYREDILQEDLQKIYATGFFTDNMTAEPVLKEDGTINLVFNLQENIVVNQVDILGNTVISHSELNPFIIPLKGKPQNLSEINNAIRKIENYYHEKGYILAGVSSVDDSASGILSFTILEGVINEINISGNERTKDYVIERNIMTKSGTVYNEEYLKRDLSKIYSTQVFDEVNREIIPSKEQPGSFDVEIVVREKVTNSVALGGGVDTGLGAFGSISFKEDNFRGTGQKLSLTGILGSGILMSDASIKNHMNYQAELNFFEPYFINADNSLMSKLYFREMGSWNVPLAIEQRIGLRGGIEHKVGGSENLKTSFSLGIEHINLKEGDLNRITELFARNNLNMAYRSRQLTDGLFLHLTPGVKYNTVDDITNPRNGILAQAQFNEAVGLNNFKHTNGRLSGAVTKFFPVRKKSSFSITAKAGAKIHGDNMPEIMAYRLGGPYTIRGYKMNGVGSGDSFIMGSAELATPLPFVDRLKWDIIKNMRLTFFVDAGEVFDPITTNILYDRPLHAITAGVGLRLYIPGLGPISVDYGLPVTNPGNYGNRGGYFTFGTGGLNGYYGY